MMAKKSKRQRVDDAWVRWKSQPIVREFIARNDAGAHDYLHAAFVVGSNVGRRV
jgi:hypothetical protein